MTDELGTALAAVVELAVAEARALGHDFVGVEHLLLGLLSRDDDPAAQALASLDISKDLVRERIVEIDSPGRDSASIPSSLPLTPRAKRVLALAGGIAHNLQAVPEEPHLLLAIAEEGESVAAVVLKEQLGPDLDAIWDRVAELVVDPGDLPSAVSPPRPPVHRPEGELPKCSFCGKGMKQVRKLIAGPGVYICDECVDLCVEILDETSEGDSGR